MKKKRITNLVVYVLISLLGLIMLYPLIWLVFASLKPSREVLSSSRLLPSEIHLDNFSAGKTLYL